MATTTTTAGKATSKGKAVTAKAAALTASGVTQTAHDKAVAAAAAPSTPITKGSKTTTPATTPAIPTSTDHDIFSGMHNMFNDSTVALSKVRSAYTPLGEKAKFNFKSADGKRLPFVTAVAEFAEHEVQLHSLMESTKGQRALFWQAVYVEYVLPFMKQPAMDNNRSALPAIQIHDGKLLGRFMSENGCNEASVGKNRSEAIRTNLTRAAKALKYAPEKPVKKEGEAPKKVSSKQQLLDAIKVISQFCANHSQMVGWLGNLTLLEGQLLPLAEQEDKTPAVAA